MNPQSFCKFLLNFSRPEGPKPSSVGDLEQPARPSLPLVYLISLLLALACWELNVMTYLVPFFHKKYMQGPWLRKSGVVSEARVD